MGMGRAIVLRLAAEGALVSILDIDKDAADATSALVADAGGDAIVVPCDLANRIEVRDAVATHLARRGGIEILVNNAGVMHGEDDLVENTPDRAWNFTFAVNLFGPAALYDEIIPFMVRAGKGAIVTCASNAGVMGTTRPVYGASKGALIGLTLALARRHQRDGLRINVVLPGAFATPMIDRVRHFPASVLHPRYRPIAGLADPAAIGGAIAFLVSDDAATINGAIVPVDGGATAV